MCCCMTHLASNSVAERERPRRRSSRRCSDFDPGKSTSWSMFFLVTRIYYYLHVKTQRVENKHMAFGNNGTGRQTNG